jgi:hypothetical protein
LLFDLATKMNQPVPYIWYKHGARILFFACKSINIINNTSNQYWCDTFDIVIEIINLHKFVIIRVNNNDNNKFIQIKNKAECQYQETLKKYNTIDYTLFTPYPLYCGDEMIDLVLECSNLKVDLHDLPCIHSLLSMSCRGELWSNDYNYSLIRTVEYLCLRNGCFIFRE